jgi:shikimate kinase
MRVFLTGFMGAGKTAVGECLAELLGRPFVDLDSEIEKRAQMTVREIFQHEGEPTFRRFEFEALSAAVRRAEVVIATGGGTMTLDNCRKLIEARGVSVWLNPPFATIVARIGGRGKEDRPLFLDEMQALELYRERLSAYKKADLHVDVGPDESPREVAARIALRLRGLKCAI